MYQIRKLSNGWKFKFDTYREAIAYATQGTCYTSGGNKQHPFTGYAKMSTPMKDENMVFRAYHLQKFKKKSRITMKKVKGKTGKMTRVREVIRRTHWVVTVREIPKSKLSSFKQFNRHFLATIEI